MDQRHSGKIQILGRLGGKSKKVLSTSKHILNGTLVAQEIMPTIAKCHLIKLKSFCTETEIVNQEKRQTAEKIKIFDTCMSKRGLISNIHKQLRKVNNKKTKWSVSGLMGSFRELKW